MSGAICFNCSLRFCDRAALQPTSGPGPKRIFLSSWFEQGVSWHRNIDSQRDMLLHMGGVTLFTGVIRRYFEFTSWMITVRQYRSVAIPKSSAKTFG